MESHARAKQADGFELNRSDHELLAQNQSVRSYLAIGPISPRMFAVAAA